MKFISFLLFTGLLLPNLFARPVSIHFENKTPQGLVGNGRSVVRVLPDRFAFHSGGTASGRFRLWLDEQEIDFSSASGQAEFFPGAVLYTVSINGSSIEILYGATEINACIAAMRVKGQAKKMTVEVSQTGQPELRPAGKTEIRLKKGQGELIFFTDQPEPGASFDKLKLNFTQIYQSGFQLHTPDSLLNRAVPFNRYLLDLGFDGHLHVCEIFRWRDVWSRDLGSGLVPGSLASGQFERAKTTIEYDLRRYATHNPRGLKVTEDASQGGSAEGTAWLAHAVWQYYLITADPEFLARAEQILKPWLEAWIDRDYREEGTLTDVTEWMDHSRFFLFPDGARILYSNVMFASALNIFVKIEAELNHPESAGYFGQIYNRFRSGINSRFWNEQNGIYDNLSLWGKRDERSAAAANILAISAGLASPEQTARILPALQKNNWRPAGSTTIFPPMTHVDISIDHNYKMWPWWNAVEARLRFDNGDVEGGLHLLRSCSKTLDDPRFPGLMEEITSIDGVTEGGNAFLTAAGSYQEAIIGGLLGIEILEPGGKRIRVMPKAPVEWTDWSAVVPLPGGELILNQSPAGLKITVTDPRVEIIETRPGVDIEGRARAVPAEGNKPAPLNYAEPVPLAYPEITKRRAAIFYDPAFSGAFPEGLSGKQISGADLSQLETSAFDALIISGNALPLHSKDGRPVKPELEKFLDKGKALVFYGATMHQRGTMGETGGVIDWYDYRPVMKSTLLRNWKFKSAGDGILVDREKETGLTKGWARPDLDETDWQVVDVPQPWENHLGPNFDGWGWYRVHFSLNPEAQGKTVYIDIGRIDDADWTFINGIQIGAENGWQRHRRFALKPSDPVYAALNFTGGNVLAIQVFDGGGGGGLYSDSAGISIETDQLDWVAIDARSGMTVTEPERAGVISWGPGGDFFNSWETSRGVFGFRLEGKGVSFEPLLSLPNNPDLAVSEVFTDFAVSKPWLFQPLAYTSTNRNLLIPDEGERYPCLARIVNTRTGGEFILIPASLTGAGLGPKLLRQLGIMPSGQ